MTPVEALERIVHCLDRAHDTSHRSRAFVRALQVVRETDPAELAERAHEGTLTELDGIGDSTAKVITEALAGEVPIVPGQARARDLGAAHARTARSYRGAAPGRLPQPLDVERRRCVDRGDGPHRAGPRPRVPVPHRPLARGSPSPTASTGSACSPRWTRSAALNERAGAVPHPDRAWRSTSWRTAGSTSTTTCWSGSTSWSPASTRSCGWSATAMTERMVLAAANPHVDILGHCTGRLIGKRPPSTFDADYVFAACAQFHTAVEINSRPERLDPPRELLDLAVSYGCWFSIDSDAHATGQLEWQPHGCNRAAELRGADRAGHQHHAGRRAAGLDVGAEPATLPVRARRPRGPAGQQPDHHRRPDRAARAAVDHAGDGRPSRCRRRRGRGSPRRRRRGPARRRRSAARPWCRACRCAPRRRSTAAGRAGRASPGGPAATGRRSRCRRRCRLDRSRGRDLRGRRR